MSAPERIWANEGLEWHSFDCSDVKAGWTHPYILATREALAKSPEVAKLIADAEARGMENTLTTLLMVSAELKEDNSVMGRSIYKAIKDCSDLVDLALAELKAKVVAIRTAAAPDLARALLDTRAELAAAQQREAALSDPICVHVNMLRGTIAKPTLEQIIHLYGVDALCKALMPVIVREAEAAIIRKGGTL